MSPAVPLLVALRGMPGIGKTALARAVGRELGWPVLDKDDIKEVVYGRASPADEVSYDLLQTEDARLLDEWMANWSDLIDFEVLPVLTSTEAAEAIAPRL